MTKQNLTKILFVLADIKFFFSHRQWLAKDLLNLGVAVHLACPNADKSEGLKDIGVVGHHLNISAGGMNPFKDFSSALQIKSIIKKIDPDIVQGIGLKPSLPAALACRISGHVKSVSLFTGLGFLFTSEGRKAKYARTALSPFFKFLFLNENSTCIFQNPDDFQEFMSRGFVKRDQVRLIEGSGVILSNSPLSPPSNNIKVKVLMPARLVGDKGVREYINAARLVKETLPDIIFQIAGDRDPKNPSCISEEEIEEAKDIIEFLGYQENMAPLYQNADIVCLPSYREGLPRALLEAAATGRPLISTDVPGCRQIAIHEKNALVVPAKDSQALASALKYMIANPAMRERFGDESRKMVEQKFSMKIINSQMIEVYKQVLES